MDLSIVIPNRSDPRLAETLKQILNSCATLPEIVVVQDGTGFDDSLPAYARQVVLARPGGTSAARHAGVVAASNEAVFTCDSHMVFPFAGWAETVRTELAKQWNQITCCQMCGVKAENPVLPEKPTYYSGARIHLVSQKKNGERWALDAQWKSQPIGEIPAVMGACYGLNRSWYLEALQGPWKLGRGWGLDEETLSLTNWICGGKSRLIDSRVGHIFGTQRAFKWTPAEMAAVWANRLRLIAVLPMAEGLRGELTRWVLGSPGAKNRRTLIDAALAEMRPMIAAHRSHLSAHGRTVEDYFEYFGEEP